MKKAYIYLALQIILLTCVQLQAQQWEWVKHIGGKGNDVCSNIVIDNNENIYARIGTNDTLYIDNEIFYNGGYIVKLDSSGHLIWKKTFSYSVENMAIDSSNNIYVLGSFNFNDTIIMGSDTLIPPHFPHYYAGMYAYLAKYDSAFNPIWAKEIGAMTPKDLKIVDNNIYISGYFVAVICENDTIYAYNYELSVDAIILKYSTEGNYLNHIQINNYGVDMDENGCTSLKYTLPISIAIDNHENVYASISIFGVAGIGIQGHFFSTPSCSIHKFIDCKFDSTFSYKYAYAGNIGYHLLVQNNQFYIFDGTYNSLIYNDDTIPLDSANLLLVKVNNSSGMIENYSHYIFSPITGGDVVLNDLNFLTALPNNFIIDNDTLTSYFYNSSIQYPMYYPIIYILKYDTNLKIIKHIHISDLDNTFDSTYTFNVGAIMSAVSSHNDYYIGNNFLTNILIADTIYSSFGKSDFIIGKLVDNANNVPNLPYKTSFFTVFPNPTTGNIEINSNKPNKNAVISIYDMYGRNICSSVAHDFPLQINLTGNESGLYFVKITTTDGKVYVGKIVYQ